VVKRVGTAQTAASVSRPKPFQFKHLAFRLGPPASKSHSNSSLYTCTANAPSQNAKRGTGQEAPRFAYLKPASEVASIADGSAPQKRCVNGCQESRQGGVIVIFLLALATSIFDLLQCNRDCKRKEISVNIAGKF